VSATDRALLDMARALTAAYTAHTRPRAVMLVGSTALQLTDNYSDIDLIAYYDVAPSPEQLDAARLVIGAQAYTRPGPHVENYILRGVECQVGHFVIDEFEQRLSTVLDHAEPESSVHKELMGLVDARALHGRDLIERWQLQAGHFPQRLRVTMAEHYLAKMFPVWYCREALSRRDTRLWLEQELLQIAICILGVLAGVNQVYFSPLQLKRTHRFAATLKASPTRLADRLEALFDVCTDEAVKHVEQLVAETLEVVRTELPEADIGVLRHQPDERQAPWPIP
jgi:hypothetical protein